METWTWLYDVSCEECVPASEAFNASESNTYEMTGETEELEIGYASIVGFVGFDTVRLGPERGAVFRQPLLLLFSADGLEDFRTDGHTVSRQVGSSLPQ